MDDFTVSPSTSPSPVRSGPWLRTRIPRGAPSKTIGIPCIFEVPLMLNMMTFEILKITLYDGNVVKTSSKFVVLHIITI